MPPPALLAGRQTRIIQRIAAVFADGLAVLRASVEHQPRTPEGAVGEDREHPPLVVIIEVKKAVPGEDGVEAPAKREACASTRVTRKPYSAKYCATGRPGPSKSWSTRLGACARQTRTRLCRAQSRSSRSGRTSTMGCLR